MDEFRLDVTVGGAFSLQFNLISVIIPGDKISIKVPEEKLDDEGGIPEIEEFNCQAIQITPLPLVAGRGIRIK